MTDIAPGTIGQSLRNRRLQNNKTIEDVADATRIQAKFLKALEEERWAELPARVFLDGFLVKYAEFLGLDGQDLLRQLRQQLGQTDKPAFTNPEPVPEAAGGGSGWSARRGGRTRSPAHRPRPSRGRATRTRAPAGA